MTDDRETIRLLKMEIQDLQDQLADGYMPDVEFLDDLDLRRIRRRVMQEAMNRCNGNVREAALLLGIDRTSLSTFVRRYKLERPKERDRLREMMGKTTFRGVA